MDIKAGVSGTKRGMAIISIVLGALVLGGCTSEADLVRTLSTETDGAIRTKVATDLAQHRSLEATQQLVTAAAGDQTAAAGLAALTEQYGVVLNSTVQETIVAGRAELGKSNTSILEETVDCLGCVGNVAALEILGDFALVDGSEVDGLGEVQSRGLGAMGTIGTKEAIAKLIEVGSGLEKGQDGDPLRSAASSALDQIGQPAVEPLMKVAAEDEWACEALAVVGSEAVPALIEVLGSQKWAEATLAEMGEPAIEALVGRLSGSDKTSAHRALGALLRMYKARDTKVTSVLVNVDMVPVLIGDLANKAFSEENAATKRDGFDHEAVGQKVLVEIGEPAVAPLLASSYEQKWPVLLSIGADAVPALTTTMNGSNRVASVYAAVTLVYIGEHSPEAVKWFTDALERKDLKVIADNYLYYIGLGKAGSEQVIADALLQYGDKQMGLDCLNSGNDTLAAAGRKWGSKHGYRVYSSNRSKSAMQWGL